jgi:YceI-like domain
MAAAAGGRARAEPVTYRAAPGPDGAPSLRVDLPYTFGTHQFEVREIKGEVHVEWGGTPAVSGRLAMPLTGLRGGGETLSCHMHEALGLDYTRSAFPGEHVCSGGRLPATGKDAIAFPEIVFEIRGAKIAPAGPGRMGLSVAGRWTIHGVSRDDTLGLELTPLGGAAAHPRIFRVEGTRKIRLADFGIKVKRALVVTAGEEATVKINLVLEGHE